jgi:protein-S-isoprenylcysteine O-methyltransferase Ste14
MQPRNVVFLGGFIVYVVIRGVFERRTRASLKVISRRDARDVTLMAIVGVGAIVLPLLYLLTPWLAFADYHLPSWIAWCGAAVMVAALWLFWRSHADLGENWSVTLEVRKGHQLITHGVYRLIRHPMYAAIWVFSLAQGLLLPNWLAGWGAFVLFAPLYLARVAREEQMMCDVFGAPYRDYMRRTGRLFPRMTARP